MLRSAYLYGLLVVVAISLSCGPAPTRTPTPAPVRTQPTPTAVVGLAEKVNLNTATRDDLARIPGISDPVIRVIIENQPYVSVGHFKRELAKLIPPDQIAAYQKSVFVPVEPNDSDTETLMQLPGVNAQMAIELGRARPYTSPEAFYAKLGELVSPANVEAARPYISAM